MGYFKQMILGMLLLVVSTALCSCATTNSREQSFAGTPSHERHSAGYQSQSGLH